MKTIHKISFQEIESIPELVKDFLNHNIEGFEENTFSSDHFRNQIHIKQNTFTSEQRKVLAETLESQMSGLELSSKQRANLEDLKQVNTFTITTGHQLNLFSGPVFFVYKILQTIKTCSYLKQNFPDFNFVPLYWMASEDHDFAEINHFTLFGKSYSWETEQRGEGPWRRPR